MTPAAGGPAEGAGVKPQDAILAIGDKPTDGMSLYEAASLLQARGMSPPCRTICVGSPAEITNVTEGAVKGEGSTGRRRILTGTCGCAGT